MKAWIDSYLSNLLLNDVRQLEIPADDNQTFGQIGLIVSG
jgi:hypothetical protein